MEETEPGIPAPDDSRTETDTDRSDPDTPALGPLAFKPGSEPRVEEAAERQQLGPYRLLHRLGEGGMGEVWLAEQDAPVRRQVALKVIKRGMDTRRVIARFEVERQALAMMDHPAIARVLDAGETPRGRPYFVMEYVRGVPITDYCNRHKLSVRQRLLLFLQVCEGVQHAHQKAVIHRDLKPSNILVAEHQGRAVPKIIDFGVAKATAQRLTDKSLYTELGQMVGTPEFMSPEQAELTAEDVDTRTDVYSLGAVLYTLLVGAMPFDSETLRKEGPEALRRRIRDVDPPRPSTRVRTLPESRAATTRRGGETTTLVRQLSGDLDWIVMKAMDKDRNRRYGSPQELAADLGRFLDDEPVEARPPSTLYRMRKFARRHRGGVTAAAVVLVLLVAFAVAMALQARRLAQERDQKETALAEAQAVTRFLTGMLGAVDPLEGGGDVTVREVLDSASARLGTAFTEQPRVEARVRMAIGRGYGALGLHGKAEDTLRTAHTLRRSLLGADHPDTLWTLAELAAVVLGEGRLEEAEELYTGLLEARGRVLGPQHLNTRWTRNNLAMTYYHQGRFADAEELLVELLETVPAATGANDGGGEAGLEEQTLAAKSNLAVVYHVQGRYAEAEELYREALAVQERILGLRHPQALKMRNNLGELLADRGEPQRAAELLREVLADKRAVYGDDHPSTIYTMEQLARAYRDQGRPELAEPLLREAWQDRLRTLGPENPETLAARAALDALHAPDAATGDGDG